MTATHTLKSYYRIFLFYHTLASHAQQANKPKEDISKPKMDKCKEVCYSHPNPRLRDVCCRRHLIKVNVSRKE